MIYIFHPRDSTTALRDEDISVPGGDYSVSLFIVEEVGLVFSRTALSPIGVSVNGGKCDYGDIQLIYRSASAVAAANRISRTVLCRFFSS